MDDLENLIRVVISAVDVIHGVYFLFSFKFWEPENDQDFLAPNYFRKSKMDYHFGNHANQWNRSKNGPKSDRFVN